MYGPMPRTKLERPYLGNAFSIELTILNARPGIIGTAVTAGCARTGRSGPM